MKLKAAIVIAALMIASLGILTPTSTVTAFADQPTVSITQTRVRDNAAVLITLTVTNPSAGVTIENILIKDIGAGFTNPFGGNENVSENWDNIADNLIAVGDNMKYVRDNILNAVTFIKNAGAALIDFACWEDNAAYQLRVFVENDNVWNAGQALGLAPQYWKSVGAALQSEPFNFGQAAVNMKLAARKESTAGRWLSVFTGPSAPDNDFKFAGDNILNAATWVDNFAAENLDNTILGAVENNLDNVRIAWDNAGAALGYYPTTAARYTAMMAAANYMENYMAIAMANAVENLRRAVLALDNAGIMLENIVDQHLENARWILDNYARDSSGNIPTGTPPDNFLDVDAVENLSRAGFDLDLRPKAGVSDNYDNLLGAGENLKNAALSFDVANWIGPLFASDIIGWNGETSTTSARYYISQAGESMDNENNTSLTNAANYLYSAGQRLAAAGNKLKDAKALLSPTTGWGLETGGVAGSNGVLISPIQGENKIAAGTSQTFSFFWAAPDISVEEAHTIRVWTYTTDNTASTPTDFTVTVDGAAPSKVSAVISQTGLAVNGLVGRSDFSSTITDNTFTITITASEAVSSIGQVLFDNRDTTDNVLPPVTLTSTDNIVWTATVDTTSWSTSLENLRVRIASPWGADAFGLENANDLLENFVFDVRPPVIVFSGLSGLQAVTQEMKPGTTTSYYRTNDTTWTITTRAEDNQIYQADNDATWVSVAVLVDNVSNAMTRTPEDNWTVGLTLGEGAHTITVRATDRAGNKTDSALSPDLYIDNTSPTVEFVSVNGILWTDDDLKTNDNTVTILLTIHDAGWGIVRNAGGDLNADNLWVYLDNDDNIMNGENIELENLGVWDSGAVGTFENTYENVVSGTVCGLRSGYWWVVVKVGDNVQAQLSATTGQTHIENENYSRRFIIDVAKPTVPTPSASVNPLDGTSLTDPLVQTTISLTIRGTGLTTEAGSTITVYIKDATTGTTAGTGTTTVGSDGSWSKAVDLPQGGTKYQIEVTCTDLAGNESDSQLYGFVLADAVAPAVTISAVEAAGVSLTSPYSTDQTTVVISGTVDKDTWETYNSGAMAVTATIQVGSATPGALTIGSSGAFTISAALSTGTNTITVRATDSVGHSDSETVTIERVAPTTTTPPVDTSAPTVTLDTLPASTTDASITVSGTVTKDTAETYSDITLTVQVGLESVAVPISADGSYEWTVSLSMGQNTIAVQAVDKSLNASTPRTAAIERVAPTADTSAPTVTLGTLPTSTDAASVTITGTVTKDATETYSDITVKVQSSLTSVEVQAGTDGSFSATVGLVEGSNTIGVQAVDKVGNASISATATITRTVTPWATYAIIVIVIALILAAIAIFRKR